MRIILTHAQEEINFLDFRASRVVVDSHRSSLVAVDRDRESVLLDGLKELIDVKSRFLSLHLQLHVNSKLSWQRNFHLKMDICYDYDKKGTKIKHKK